MNKKNLSVVMAGAMLATSVAPVLADTTTDNQIPQTEFTVNNSNKGLLIKELREFVNSKKFSNVKENDDHAGLSVYYVTMSNNPGKYYDATGGVSTTGADQNYEDLNALADAIQTAPKDTKVYVYTRGFEERDGKVYYEGTEKYTKDTLEAAYKAWNDDANKETNYPFVYKMTLNAAKDKLFVEVRKAEDNSKLVTKTFSVGEARVNFKVALDKDGDVLAANAYDEFDHFKVLAPTSIDDELLYTITISDVDKEYVVTLPELYDGLFLTDKGQELLDTMKKYDSEGWEILDANNSDIANDTKGDVFEVDRDARGIYTVVIKFKKPIAGIDNKEEIQTVKITSNNKDQLEIFAKGISVTENYGHSNDKIARNFPVEVLAGANRYETAVKVAKENASIRSVAEDGNLVLVNGNSLVDGLAAAPLAASVVNGTTLANNNNYVSPILLTDANGIPKATKDYMKELVGHQRIMNLDKITVYIVGGEAVISKAVENDLKEIGFRVVRAGGDDREETSLKVAELMEKDTNANRTATPFVVGANGEADAMSIAAVAAKDERPIIVESVHGIKEDTINYLKGYKNTGVNSKDVTIVGGEAVVSKATEEKLKEEGITVDRVAGSNRQETNAKVIQNYYKNTTEGDKIKRFVVSKDGKSNKSELIDALTATSLAVKYRGPIVLGTNSLTSSQINAMELNASNNGVYVYQVGHGVSRDIVKTIAERIGLAK